MPGQDKSLFYKLPHLTEAHILYLCSISLYFKGLDRSNSVGRARLANMNDHQWPLQYPRRIFHKLILFALGYKPAGWNRDPLYLYFGAAKYLQSDFLQNIVLKLYIMGYIGVCPVTVDKWAAKPTSRHLLHLRDFLAGYINMGNIAGILVRLRNIFHLKNVFEQPLMILIFRFTGLNFEQVEELLIPNSPQRFGSVEHKLAATILADTIGNMRFGNIWQAGYVNIAINPQAFGPKDPTIYLMPCCHTWLHLACLLACLFHSPRVMDCPACCTSILHKPSRKLQPDFKSELP